MSLAVCPRAAVTPERGARAARRTTPDDRRPAAGPGACNCWPTAGSARSPGCHFRRPRWSAGSTPGQWLTLRARRRRELAGPERAGGRRARLFEPMELTTGLVVFVHGGGWQFGSIDAPHGVCAFLSKTTGLKVLSLDYRPAWQAHPAAFDDVVAGFREAVDRADELGVARDRIAIAGDSAGGNIKLAAAPALGADPTYRPGHALIYPVGRRSRPLRIHALVPRAARPGDRAPRHAPLRPRPCRSPRPALRSHGGKRPLGNAARLHRHRWNGRPARPGRGLRRAAARVGRGRERAAVPEPPHGFLNLLVDPDAERAAAEIGRGGARLITAGWCRGSALPAPSLTFCSLADRLTNIHHRAADRDHDVPRQPNLRRHQIKIKAVTYKSVAHPIRVDLD